MADKVKPYPPEPQLPNAASAPDGKANTFRDMQESMDEADWTGRGTRDRLPGGGNFER